MRLLTYVVLAWSSWSIHGNVASNPNFCFISFSDRGVDLLTNLGRVSGRLSRFFENSSDWLRNVLPWFIRLLLVPVIVLSLFFSILQVVNPNLLLSIEPDKLGPMASLPGVAMFIASAFMAS